MMMMMNGGVLCGGPAPLRPLLSLRPLPSLSSKPQTLESARTTGGRRAHILIFTHAHNTRRLPMHFYTGLQGARSVPPSPPTHHPPPPPPLALYTRLCTTHTHTLQQFARGQHNYTTPRRAHLTPLCPPLSEFFLRPRPPSIPPPPAIPLPRHGLSGSQQSNGGGRRHCGSGATHTVRLPLTLYITTPHNNTPHTPLAARSF